MTKQSNIKRHLILAICMLLTSIFMTISYHRKILANEADQLTTIAYYVWIVSIFIWAVVFIYNWRRLKQASKK